MVTWTEQLRQARDIEQKVKELLRGRGLDVRDGTTRKHRVGLSIKTTDEDLHLYDKQGNYVGWVSVKATGVTDRHKLPEAYKRSGRGYMVGEVRSLQWRNPPICFVWYNKLTGYAFGALCLSLDELLVYPEDGEPVVDTRKSALRGETVYCHPSYVIPPQETLDIDELAKQLTTATAVPGDN
ncbi:MAG: hypothetical protein J0L70_03090 [Leptolyngbya sp. UWPOB_LEPTO1]|uniref:hypothetical protein n=1 Tax=Leptolyngbya sp. UWPOB_LEPTO1 TaxID=2815653 RepID=UPI001AC47B48|nr:hypothetical protein [Leptolyngbya sp. UWPOB_LEPTO1]MBN8559488.1 hypothetical protein [Leptolyngbya sp. UWPOB_LEPTO1]